MAFQGLQGLQGLQGIQSTDTAPIEPATDPNEGLSSEPVPAPDDIWKMLESIIMKEFGAVEEPELNNFNPDIKGSLSNIR